MYISTFISLDATVYSLEEGFYQKRSQLTQVFKKYIFH